MDINANEEELDNCSDDDSEELNPIDYELHELNECLNEFWLKNELLIEKCEQLLEKVNKHKNDCNIAKSVGTGVSGMGSVALISGLALTPFTIGFSSVLTIGGGLATAAGTVATIGTDFADSLQSKRFCQELRQLAEQRNRSANRLSRQLFEFDSFVANNYGLDLDRDFTDNGLKCESGSGFLKMFHLLAKGSSGAYKMGNNSVKFLDAIKEFKSLKAAKAVETNAGLAKDVAKGVVSLAPQEAKGIGSAAIRTTGASAGKLAFRGASAAVGLVFTVIDAVSLVKDWNKSHPTVDVIKNFVEELEKDTKLIQSIHSFISNIFAELISDNLINDILKSVNSSGCYEIDLTDDSDDEISIIFDSNENMVLYNKSSHGY